LDKQRGLDEEAGVGHYDKFGPKLFDHEIVRYVNSKVTR
jgi:hypothetical protein